MAVTPFAARPDMLVGDSFRVVTGFSTVVIQCQCEAKTVLVLQGKDNPCVCPNCRKAFAIAQAGKLEVGEVILPVEDEDVH